MTAGQKVKKYLTERGIMQSWLAKKIGMSNSEMSDILAGKKEFRIDKYLLACEALGKNPACFTKK